MKRRLYVVHTSALPPDCELRVAPTGTAGTIRLDEMQRGHGSSGGLSSRVPKHQSATLEDDALYSSPWSSASNEYGAIAEEEEETYTAASPSMGSSFVFRRPVDKVTSQANRPNSMFALSAPPLVSMRPASSTDAWFILNLLSAVPFLTR